MSDLVERLRSCHQQVNGPQLVNPDGPEAADEIEQLRSALGGIATKMLGPDALMDALPADVELQVGVVFDCYLARIAHLERLLVLIYNHGYHAGHEDTVEGAYTDVHYNDMSSYHDDIVSEIIKDNPPTRAGGE